MARSTRKQPFCWQEKKILRLLRKKFKGLELSKYRNLYLTITEIDSDFNGREIEHYTKTIATYSGLARDWIPPALKKFEELKIIEFNIIRDPKNNRPLQKHIIFTPEKVDNVKPVIDKHVNENPAPLEDSSFLEDSSSTEEKDPAKAKNAFACPFCGSENIDVYSINFDSTPIDYHCRECERIFRIDTNSQAKENSAPGSGDNELVEKYGVRGHLKEAASGAVKNSKYLYEEIVSYLNEKAGKKFRPSTPATQKHIRARIKEGFTLSDFKTVIDKKSAKWKGTEWDDYLRPETLFCAQHFESYLNENGQKKKFELL